MYPNLLVGRLAAYGKSAKGAVDYRQSAGSLSGMQSITSSIILGQLHLLAMVNLPNDITCNTEAMRTIIFGWLFP